MSFSTDVLRCVGKYTWGKKFTPVNRVTFIDNAVYLLNLDSGEATGADESAGRIRLLSLKAIIQKTS